VWHTLAMTVPVLAVVLACALALRLTWAWGDLEALLRFATSDDAFYYFQIAHNLAAGAAPSLDGETPTNGFHPLWLLLATLAQRVAPDPQAALRAALTLSALLGTASTGLAFVAVRRLTQSAPAALFAASIVAVHPAFVTESVNGLETSAAVFTTALATLGFFALADAERVSVRQGLLFGLVGGALLLARTDAFFLWGCLLLALLVRAQTPSARTLPVVAGAVSAACVAPWLLWNLLRFGTIVQISGVALPEPLRADFLATHGDSLTAALGRSAYLVRQAFLSNLPHLYLVPRGLPAWPALAAGALLLVSMLRFGDARTRRSLALLLPPAAGIALGLLWHAGVRWWTREWYFAPAGWLLAVFAGAALGFLHQRLGSRVSGKQSTAGFAAAALALAGLALSGPYWRVPSEHRVQQLEAALWLKEHTRPQARVGAFNAGILSYFSGRTVVNLDGAVNARAYEARSENRLADYVVASQLDYVVDWSGTLPMAGCGAPGPLRCEQIAVIGEPLPRFAGSPIWVLRVHSALP